MITDLYKAYFQKSRAFIYPLTNMLKTAQFTPDCTYLTWKGKYEAHDIRLMAKYSLGDDIEKWNIFHNTVLNISPFYEACYYCEDENSVIIVFDMRARGDAFKSVISGKYSKITPEMRSLILLYYGYNTSEWAYIETFLQPAKFSKLYAKLLDCSEEDLVLIGELCNAPDMDKEHLVMSVKNKYENIIS